MDTTRLPNFSFSAALTGLKVKSLPDSMDEVVVTLCFAVETDVAGQEKHYRVGLPMLDRPALFRFSGQVGAGYFERTVKGGELTKLDSSATEEALVKVKLEVSTEATLEELLDLFKDFLPPRGYKLAVDAWLEKEQLGLGLAEGAPEGEPLQ